MESVALNIVSVIENLAVPLTNANAVKPRDWEMYVTQQSFTPFFCSKDCNLFVQLTRESRDSVVHASLMRRNLGAGCD